MNGVEGDETKKQYINRDKSVLECRAILFGVYSSISTLQKSSMGYLEELSIKPQSNNQKLLKALKSINSIEAKQVHLLELLNKLIDKKQYKVSAVHPEYLFDKISHANGLIRFSTPRTYEKSIISIDEVVFCDSINALLSCISKVKNLNLSFRKREKYFVIKISANKPNWIRADLVDNISNAESRFGSNLDQLVVAYSIDLLKMISVRTSLRNHEGQYSLSLRLPSASQLNVFE